MVIKYEAKLSALFALSSAPSVLLYVHAIFKGIVIKYFIQ